ncbi:MAG: hypothetical protein IMW98_03600 [Firmicutes bacterium]|nr:hypothetical protein [Bacillota bacterium]
MAHPFQSEQDPHKASLSQPFGATFRQAQAYCNFVVLQPDRIPGAARVVGPSVRPAGARFPSVRFLLAGPGLRLRVKEYLNDWNPTASAPNLAVRQVPFVSHGTVGWIGLEPGGRRAAVHTRWRTTVEVRVLHGDPSDEEILEFFHGLRPARPEAPALFHAVPYAELGWYLSRGWAPPLGEGAGRTAGEGGAAHAAGATGAAGAEGAADAAAAVAVSEAPAAACHVPPKDGARPCRWTTLEDAEAAFGRPLPVPEPLPPGYRLDSVGIVEGNGAVEGDGAGRGVEVLLRHVGNSNDVIWCRAWPRAEGKVGDAAAARGLVAGGAGDADAAATGAGERTAGTQEIVLDDRRVRLYEESVAYGGRYAFWEDGAYAYAVCARAGLTLTRTLFVRAVASVVRRLGPHSQS